MNKLKGALPQQGIRSMSSLLRLDIMENSFSGRCPEHGLKCLRSMQFLRLCENELSGSLGEGLRGLLDLTHLEVERN
eukprot:4684623-Amphidinium_carterae.1